MLNLNYNMLNRNSKYHKNKAVFLSTKHKIKSRHFLMKQKLSAFHHAKNMV